jgi:hypothetical protein
VNQYPVAIDVRVSEKGTVVSATTSIDRALQGAETLQGELRCIEIDYRTTLAAVKEALASTGSGRFRDPRSFWFAGKFLCDFIARLEAHGFYLVGKTATPARHLAVSAKSVQKIMAFYRRHVDPFRVDPSVPCQRIAITRNPRSCNPAARSGRISPIVRRR